MLVLSDKHALPEVRSIVESTGKKPQDKQMVETSRMGSAVVEFGSLILCKKELSIPHLIAPLIRNF